MTATKALFYGGFTLVFLIEHRRNVTICAVIALLFYVADKLISKQHLSSPDVFGSLNAARKRLQSAHKSAPKCCILLYDSDVTVTDYMETEAKAMHSNNITIVSVGKVTQVISIFANRAISAQR